RFAKMSDTKSNPGYVDQNYLQEIVRVVQPAKLRGVQLMHIQPGFSALDVGCGSGIDTLALAQIVGASGRVVGIDYDETMIALANQKADSAGVSSWVQHKVADGSTLPFDANAFDASHCERVFQHVLQPERLLSEMVRVTRPGGWIVVIDTDYSSAA